MTHFAFGRKTAITPENEFDPSDLDDRRHTIEAIRQINPTAGIAFLAEFNTAALKDYLEHLRHARHKHVRLAGWLQRRTARRTAA